MTLIQKLTLFAMASITVAGSASAGEPGRLTVRVHGMRNSDGQALCALFDKAGGFPDGEHALKGTRAKVTQGRASCTFATPGRAPLAPPPSRRLPSAWATATGRCPSRCCTCEKR